jgi:hypothetical protein
MQTEELRALADLIGQKIADTLADRLIAELPAAFIAANEAHRLTALEKDRQAYREMVENGQTFASHRELQEAAWARKRKQDALARESEIERARRDKMLRESIGSEMAVTGLSFETIAELPSVTGGEKLMRHDEPQEIEDEEQDHGN